MLREGVQFPKAHLNVISTWGGLGDMIARLPAIRWGLEEYPHLSMTVYWQDYFLDLAQLLLPSGTRLVHRKISEASYNLTHQAHCDFNPERLTSLGLHLTQHAFLSLYDRVAPSTAAMDYPQAPEIFMKNPAGNAIVFTVAHTAPAREWPAFHVNELARRVKAIGYTPVLLGTTQPVLTGDHGKAIEATIADGLDRSLFLDLTNKTSLIQVLGVIQQAKAVVGIDNGLLHLAHCTDTPIVAGYTSVSAAVRVPFRPQGLTEIVAAQVPCYGCQSKAHFVMHDFKQCLFGDYACTLTMSADAFEEKLKKVIAPLNQAEGTL